MSDASSPELDATTPEAIAVPEPNVAPKSSKAHRRRQRGRWKRHAPIAILLASLFAAWFLYAVVWPPLEIRNKLATTKWKYSPSDPEISITIRSVLRTCEFLYAFWFFYLGASIGSFINVVANRTPQGKTIVSRGSHCPFCDTPLRLLDNIPVFGWVALRGRCRTCHLPISPRYLAMEVLLGAAFVVLAILELMGNGWNLPYRDWKIGAGIVNTVFYPKWGLIAAAITHASLFAIAIMLIGSHMDRLKFPKVPLVVIAILFLILAIVNPLVSPVRWAEPWGAPYDRMGDPYADRAVTSAIGLFVGMVLGGLFVRFAPSYGVSLNHRGNRPAYEDLEPIQGYLDGEPQLQGAPHEQGSTTDKTGWVLHSVAIFGIAGTALGWQAVVLVAVIALPATWLAYSLAPLSRWTWLTRYPDLRPQVLALVIVTITLFLHHCFWRQASYLSFLPF